MSLASTFFPFKEEGAVLECWHTVGMLGVMSYQYEPSQGRRSHLHTTELVIWGWLFNFVHLDTREFLPKVVVFISYNCS